MDNIFYICDRRACEKCSYPQCKHTFDISHAIGFERNGDGSYWATEELKEMRLESEENNK